MDSGISIFVVVFVVVIVLGTIIIALDIVIEHYHVLRIMLDSMPKISSVNHSTNSEKQSRCVVPNAEVV